MANSNDGSLRARTEAITVSDEATFAVDPAADYQSLSQWGFDPTTLVRSIIDNEQVQIDLRGMNRPGAGLQFEAQPSFNTYMEGLGVGLEAGDGDVAALNGTGLMFQTWCGQAADLETGDTVALVTDASNITPTTPALYDVGSMIGLIDPTTGKMALRLVVTKTVSELTLHLPLPWLPVATEVIYASARHEWTETPTCTLHVKALGKDPAGNQNWKLGGVIPSLEIPETPAAAAPTLTWGIRLAGFNDYPFVEGQTAPAISRPQVMAGGEFYIRITGQAVWTPLKYGRFSLASNQEMSPDEDVNSDLGVSAWTRTANAMELVLLFKNNGSVPAGAGSIVNWREFFYEGNEAVNSFDLSFGFSRPGAGQSVLMFFHTWYVSKPVAVNEDVDGKALQRVTFAPAPEVLTTPIIIGQF